jgi:outer membrane protein OmpA-like peptidoglycan-associated protein
MMSRWRSKLVALCSAWLLIGGAQAAAQDAATPQPSEPSKRPATTTFDGDTGIWYVPTAEALPQRSFSAGVYRAGFNFVPGFTNVSDIAGTFAYGAFRNVEFFGSFKLDTRIDRDLRPLFVSDATVGGIVPRYPLVDRGWTGDNVGDFLVGVKINLLSEARLDAMALAVRPTFKLPTGDDEAGVSTGKADTFIDIVGSKVVGEAVELAAYGGAALRGDSSSASNSNGFRWGLGAAFPATRSLRATLELNGERPFDDTVTVVTPLVGVDGSQAPTPSELTSFTAATLGLTWRARNGFFVGAGLTWSLPTEDRDAYRTDEDESGDFVDYQFRIGFHPGVGRYVPPPPPPRQPPPPPPAENRPPTVQARCEPCTVEGGRSVTVTGDARDPDGDMLTYRWTAPSGTLQQPSDRQTLWTAPQQEGPVQVTVAVNDGRGGTASSAVTVQVLRPPPVVELTFEDVYFDFDRSSLRPDALRLLDDAVAKLQANPGRNIIIEGHTCNIGTAEYNLALGERRASAVRDYLASRGVAPSRIEVRSYGEERPKFDNAREETRRLNRRAALVVRVQ